MHWISVRFYEIGVMLKSTSINDPHLPIYFVIRQVSCNKDVCISIKIVGFTFNLMIFFNLQTNKTFILSKNQHR